MFANNAGDMHCDGLCIPDGMWIFWRCFTGGNRPFAFLFDLFALTLGLIGCALFDQVFKRCGRCFDCSAELITEGITLRRAGGGISDGFGQGGDLRGVIRPADADFTGFSNATLEELHGRQRSDDQLLNFSLGVLVVLLPVTDPFLHSPFAIVWDLPVGVEVIANGRAG